MPHPTDRGIRIASLHCIDLSPDEQLDIRRHMEKLNDGSASFVERDVDDASILYLRKRTWSDWWRESVAEFKAEFGLVEELEDLRSARVAAMNALAYALGLDLDERSKQQIRVVAQETNFRLADVSRVIAPETLDLSNKSFLISGFEKFDDRRRLRRTHELNRLVKEGKWPLRVDQVKDEENKVQTYVRTRSTRDAFAEFWMSAKERRSIEDAARNAIAQAFEPYLKKHRETEGNTVTGLAMPQSRGSGKQHGRGGDPESTWVKGLQDAVNPEGTRASRVELQKIGKADYAQRLASLKALLFETSAPLRIEDGRDERDDKVLYLRERRWGEFFEEEIMGLIWPQQLAEMKRDTAFMIENKLSEVLLHIRKHDDPRHAPAQINTDHVEELLSHLCTRVWGGKTVSNDVKHVSRFGCAVVQGNPLGLGANNIIFPRALIENLLCEGNRVLEQALAVVRKAVRKFTDQMKWLEQEADRKRKKWGQACTAQPVASPDRLDSEKPRFSMERFPQKMQSVRHTSNLLLVDFPPTVDGEDSDRSVEYWCEFYSSLLSSLKGTVVLAPHPDQGGGGYSMENLYGLVKACLTRSSISLSRRTGQDLLAITIAHPDEDVCDELIKLVELFEDVGSMEAKPETCSNAERTTVMQGNQASRYEDVVFPRSVDNADVQLNMECDEDTDLEDDPRKPHISSDIKDDESTADSSEEEANVKPNISPHELAPHIFAAPVPVDEGSDDDEKWVAKLDMKSKLAMHPDDFE